jgi:Tol biopolymer transport system component
MRDLKQRFGSLDALDAPDLWTEAVRRSPDSPGRAGQGGRRWVAVAVAFAVAIAGFGSAVWAFRGGSGSERTPLSPVVGNGRIAYVSNGNLWTIEPDGTDARKLTSGLPGFALQPSWSPDGMQLVFVVESYQDAQPATKGGDFDLYEIAADGSGLTRLTTDGQNFQPSWSPDGTHIAYSHATAQGAQDIWVANADGSHPVQLTQERGSALDLSPSWSPDGSEILFVSNRTNNTQIYAMNADGTGMAQLTEDAAFHANPVYSPGGTQIAFASDIGTPGLYVMDANGSDVRQLTHDLQPGPLSLTWSPDGRWIAYTSSPEGNGNIALYVLDPATGQMTRIVDVGQVCCPAWQRIQAATSTPTPAPTETSSPLATGARVSATIDVGESDAVAYGEGSVWVAQRAAPSYGGSILRIDPATNEIVATIPLETVPQWETGGGGLTVANGGVWVAGPVATPGGGSEAAIVQIDPATDSVVDTIRLGGLFADDVAVGPDGSIWVLMRTDAGDPEVVKLDPSTHQVVARLQPLNANYGRRIFAGDGGAIVDLTEPPSGAIDSTQVMEINPKTGDVLATVWLRRLPYSAMAEDKGQLWAATGRTLEQLDPTTGETIGDPAAVSNTGDVLAVGEGRVWFLDPNDRSVLHGYDPATGTVDVNVDLGKASTPIAIATSSGSVWVLDYEGTLTRIDLG